MKLIIDENADFSSSGGFGNAVLYQMCGAAPFHSVQPNNPIFNSWEKIKGIIASKIWIIGRSYAASPQRTKIKLETEGSYDFFDILVDRIGEDNFSELNIKIYALKEKSFTGDYENNDKNILLDIICIVEIFNSLLLNITEKNNISFASKYLHFHIPELVFIIDDYARKGGKILYKEKTLRLCEKEKPLLQSYEENIRDYARHVFCCYDLVMNMGKMTPRELDTILVKRGYPKRSD